MVSRSNHWHRATRTAPPTALEDRDIRIDAYGMTDVGRVRRVNEDRFFVGSACWSGRTHLFIVADGIGGNAGGDVASEVAVQIAVSRLYTKMLSWDERSRAPQSVVARALSDVVGECDDEVRAQGIARGTPGMGTTLTMACVVWPDLYVAHVGDSRCYRQRDSELEQVTTDHTLVERLVREAAIAPEEAAESPFRNVLTNAIGGSDDDHAPEVEMHRLRLEPGETLLLCSDGLFDELSDPEIARILELPGSSVATCSELVTRAKAAGGSDNITAIVARIAA